MAETVGKFLKVWGDRLSACRPVHVCTHTQTNTYNHTQRPSQTWVNTHRDTCKHTQTHRHTHTYKDTHRHTDR